MMPDTDLIQAHAASIYHREQILVSEWYGCFYCSKAYWTSLPRSTPNKRCYDRAISEKRCPEYERRIKLALRYSEVRQCVEDWIGIKSAQKGRKPHCPEINRGRLVKETTARAKCQGHTNQYRRQIPKTNC